MCVCVCVEINFDFPLDLRRFRYIPQKCVIYFEKKSVFFPLAFSDWVFFCLFAKQSKTDFNQMVLSSSCEASYHDLLQKAIHTALSRDQPSPNNVVTNAVDCLPRTADNQASSNPDSNLHRFRNFFHSRQLKTFFPLHFIYFHLYTNL